MGPVVSSLPQEPSVTGDPIGPLQSQWVIGDENAKPHDGFVEIPLARAALFVHPALKVTRVSAAGRKAGWLLGTPISLDQARMVSDRLDIASAINDVDAWVESQIYALGGSWVFILDHEAQTRVYLDCAGSLSAVFDPAQRRIGATAETVLTGEEYDRRLLPDRIDEFEVLSDGWISGDLTAHSGLFRLLANHYLDLKTFERVRHWPRHALSKNLSAEASAQDISAAASAIIEATAAAPSSFMALTGGYDTRVVLSLTRSVRRNLEFATVASPGSARDVHLARRLAREFGLLHRLLPLVQATEAQQEAWDRRVGHVVTGVNRQQDPTLWPLGNCYWMGGVGGEVARGFLWLNAEEDTQIDAVDVIDRLKLPRQANLVDSVERWLEQLPAGLNTLEILDLAYIELRNSSWAFGPIYSNPLSIKINPLISRASYRAMLSTDTSARRDNRVLQSVIQLNWPDLLTVPVNRYGDFRDFGATFLLGVRRPDKILRKARQLIRVGRTK